MKTPSEFANELLTALSKDTPDVEVQSILETFFAAAQDDTRQRFIDAWEWAHSTGAWSEYFECWWAAEPDAMTDFETWKLAQKQMHIYDLQMKTVVTQAGTGTRITTMEGDIEKVRQTWIDKLAPNSILLSIVEVTE